MTVDSAFKIDDQFKPVVGNPVDKLRRLCVQLYE